MLACVLLPQDSSPHRSSSSGGGHRPLARRGQGRSTTNTKTLLAITVSPTTRQPASYSAAAVRLVFPFPSLISQNQIIFSCNGGHLSGITFQYGRTTHVDFFCIRRQCSVFPCILKFSYSFIHGAHTFLSSFAEITFDDSQHSSLSRMHFLLHLSKDHT